ncbi:hypothetical protein GQ53DRAFT_659244 [Thozetella sp. PMI_491]|nr:hypothetical protein GQ53DRAFT_659244 [Thozetella sp. PMI_491]
MCSRGANTTCVGSVFGDCCGKNGQCGSTDEYCAIGNCQAGNCPGNGYSFDGLCGPDHSNLVCGGPYGNCCSVNGV